jgi:hypothetical protein
VSYGGGKAGKGGKGGSGGSVYRGGCWSGC